MSSLFEPRAQGDAWFRVGRVDVTSTLLVVSTGFVGLILCLFSPALGRAMFFDAEAAFLGLQLWRIVTWPLANFISFWTLLTFVLLWYFGTSLEVALGRNRMLRLYVEIWAALTVSSGLVGLLLPGTALAGLDQIEFLVLLLWIADNPTRRFFFNIPAWAFGSFILVLQVLSMVAARAWGAFVALLLALTLVAMAAKRLGLLSAIPWIPGAGSRRRRKKAKPGKPSKSGAKASTKRADTAPREMSRSQRRHLTDEERMDELLDRVSAVGLEGLSQRERDELEKLGRRRRG